MCMRKTLIASAVLLGLGLTGQAFAQATNTENGPGADTLVAVDFDATDSSTHDGDNRNNDGVAYADGYGTAAANNGGTATATFSNAFNHSKAVAETKLIGSVSGITVHDIGNVAKNWGDANGGNGGRGGTGRGGDGYGGEGTGGRGGNGGDGGSGGNGGDAINGSASAGDVSNGGASIGDAVAGDGGNGGRADHNRGGRGGDACAAGVWGGGAGSGGVGYGGVGNGAMGGAGGAGGSVANDAGTFNMSNTMSSVGQSAAGVMVAAQNSGFASLIQQGITVQANLTVGP